MPLFLWKFMSSVSDDNIIKYPKHNHFSIGFVTIGVMFIYMVYHLFTYATTDLITVYEVSQGSISNNLEYNALAIRDETVYYATESGNILYLAENLGRVGVKSNVYAIDETGEIITQMTVSSLADENIDSSSLTKLANTVSQYTLEYDGINFSKVYSFKNELSSQIEQIYNLSAMNAMEDQVNAAINSGKFHIYKSPKAGLIDYTIDGYEGVTVDDFTVDMFDSSAISVTNLKAQDSVVKDQAVFKIVNSDHWNLICQIDAATYEQLSENNYLKIKFLDDEITTWTACSFEEKMGNYYLILTLDDGLERYADSRFVHIKLMSSDISGLKIPNSAIVKKQFFTIPKSYFYHGDDLSDASLMLYEDAHTNTLITPTIYYETDDFYYVDSEKLQKGDILIKANSNEKYIVGSTTDELEGVYNVNKGYAVFKQIEVLYQNEDYSIIKTGTNYGIAMYDHIVLQGESVEENAIIN